LNEKLTLRAYRTKRHPPKTFRCDLRRFYVAYFFHEQRQTEKREEETEKSKAPGQVGAKNVEPKAFPSCYRRGCFSRATASFTQRGLERREILKLHESCISNPKSEMGNWTVCRHICPNRNL